MKAMQRGLREQVLARDNNQCTRINEGECRGRMNTIEHCFGRKDEKLWNTITLCAWHHGVDQYMNKNGLDKLANKAIAYRNATDEDLMQYKLYGQMITEREWLWNKYPQYRRADS